MAYFVNKFIEPETKVKTCDETLNTVCFTQVGASI